MAETADILSTPEQSVTLPNLSAGCSMADMANIDQVQECWDQLGEICGTQPDSDGLQQIIRSLHELIRRTEGVLRTQRRHRMHLFQCARRAGMGVRPRQARAVLPGPAPGRNTARAMGIPLSEMPLWDPFKHRAAPPIRPITPAPR